ncbi:MAG: PAS domain S-box protein [Burkholderiales bacterium]|nr:PAS domain S-box protein [Burkholderiales bacterium]
MMYSPDPLPSTDASALRREQLRQHALNGPASASGGFALAAMLAWLLEPVVGLRPGLEWLGLVALSALLRIGVALAWRRRQAAPDDAADRAWLWRFRAGFAAAGLAWSAAAALVYPAGSVLYEFLLVFIVAGLGIASLTLTSYDRAASLLFALPAVLPAALRLAFGAEQPALVAILALMLPYAGWAGNQAQRVMRENIMLRLAEARRAQHSADLLRTLLADADGTPGAAPAGAGLAGQAGQADGSEALSAIARIVARQHQLLSLLVRRTPEGFVFLDADGRVSDVNPALCAMVGLAREHIVGRSALDFVAPAEVETVRRRLAGSDAEFAASGEIRLLRADGGFVHCVNHATRVRDADGALLGAVAMFTDISAIKRGEAALRDYELVLNRLPEMVSLVDFRHGRFSYRMVNDQWCKTTGLAREQVLGRALDELLTLADADERRRMMLQCLRRRESRLLRSRFERAGAAPLLMETWYHPIVEGGGRARSAILFSRDVTRQESDRAALAASLDNLSLTLNTTGDGLFASDVTRPDEPLLFANDLVLRMFDIPAEFAGRLTPDLVNRCASRFFVDPEAELRKIAAVIKAGLPFEDRMRLNDGRVLHRRCLPYREAGRYVRVWGFRDVTAEENAFEALRATEHRYRSLLDAFPGYIACIDAELRYTYVNERLAALLGTSAERMVGRVIGEAAGTERTPQTESAIRRALGGETLVVERHMPALPTRAAMDQLVTLAPGPAADGGAALCYVFATDITALKAAQAALVGLKEEAERANLAKSQFLSRMSHELRTPLNAVLGFAQVLQADRVRPLHPAHRPHVKEIVGAGQHLLELINEVLDLSRVETGQLDLSVEAVDLAALGAECLSLMAPIAQTHGVDLAAPEPDAAARWVRADRMRLKQVLLNLLSNGIKYNSRGGSLALTCTALGAEVRIDVTDTGPGLAPHEVARLFRPFERLNANTTGIEGTGIGLALSQRLVRSMGGEIGVESESGRGSRFWVRLATAQVPEALPAARAPESAAAQPVEPVPAVTAAPGTHTVLYIEDTEFNIALMHAAMEHVPEVRLIDAELPEQGLALAQSERPTLILLDIQLPGIDGFEVLRRLRADAATRAIPVIALSANAMSADIRRATEAGFDGYLTKPVDLERLVAVVRQALAEAAPAAT